MNNDSSKPQGKRRVLITLTPTVDVDVDLAVDVELDVDLDLPYLELDKGKHVCGVEMDTPMQRILSPSLREG